MTNLSKINELSSYKSSFVLNLLKRYQPLIETVLLAIHQNADGRDLSKIYDALHKMKPNLELIGATDAHQLGLLLEKQCKNDSDKTDEFVNQLKIYHEKLALLSDEIDQLILNLEAK
jgi:HPt (histidine-containing phosphotransfer) domain-containing protein